MFHVSRQPANLQRTSKKPLILHKEYDKYHDFSRAQDGRSRQERCFWRCPCVVQNFTEDSNECSSLRQKPSLKNEIYTAQMHSFPKAQSFVNRRDQR